MSLRSPMSRVLGLGSAKDGTGHWWSQRMTAVAMIPLTLWFAYALATADNLGHAAVVAWLQMPWNAVLLALLLTTLVYHSKLGVQVVVEDYVHVKWLKIASLMVINFAHIVAGAVGLFAVLSIALGDSA